MSSNDLPVYSHDGADMAEVTPTQDTSRTNRHDAPIADNPPLPAPTVLFRTNRNNYTLRELMSLLRIIEDVLPIGPEEWAQCTSRHAETYHGRDLASLRRKYNNLHRMKVPTGDPSCPDEVKLAKKSNT